MAVVRRELERRDRRGEQPAGCPTLRDGLDVRDIMDEGFTTTRVTDPMNPHYFMNGMETCDDPIRTKPRALPKAIPGPYRSLDGDILPDPTKPDFSHIYDHFLGPSQGSAPPSARGGSAPRQAPAPAVNRLVLKSSDGRPRATPRSGRSGPGSARSTGRRVLATPHDRREAQQDAADRAAVAALH